MLTLSLSRRVPNTASTHSPGAERVESENAPAMPLCKRVATFIAIPVWALIL